MSENEKAMKPSSVDIPQLASDVCQAMVKGDALPAEVGALTARQYTTLLNEVAKRADLYAKTGAKSYNQAAVAALLSPGQHKPKADAMAETYGAAIALAGKLDSTGGVAGRLLNDVLQSLKPTAHDVQVLQKKIGIDWELVASVAATWEKAPIEERPTSSAVTGLARLLSIYLGTLRKAAPVTDSLTISALQRISSSITAIRLKDLRGDMDPLLTAALPQVLAHFGGLPDKPGRRDFPGSDLPVQEVGGNPPDNVPGDSSDSRTALRTAMRLLIDVSKDLEAAEESGKRITALTAELGRITRERNEAMRELEEIRVSNVRLKETVSVKSTETSLLETQLTAARTEVEDWKRECKLVEGHATAHAKKEVSLIKSELDSVIERFARPAEEIAKKPVLDENATDRLRINLRNLVQRLERLVGREREAARNEGGGRDMEDGVKSR